MRRSLSKRELEIIDRHASGSGMRDGVRVQQWKGAWSVFYEKSGRLWVHNDTHRKQAYQELYFYSSRSTVGTLTCSHPIKLWDERRYLTPRETARLQGFPDSMILPDTRCARLFGNAVSVGCAAFAISRVCGTEETVRHLDVCSGIGGFAFALGKRVRAAYNVGFSEVMQAAKDCYTRNFTDSPDLGDARSATWPECDLLTAGFPCQPFSCSSTRDRRSRHVSRDFYKVVLDAALRSNATRVVLENVVSFQTLGRDKFEELLASLEAMGFSTSFSVLDSADSGVPQQRKRLYIVASKLAPPLPWERPAAQPTALRDILGD
jgi:site-specific DNA-cytosine methylase